MEIKIIKCVMYPDQNGFVFTLNTGMEFAIDLDGFLYIDITSQLIMEEESYNWIFNSFKTKFFNLANCTIPLFKYHKGVEIYKIDKYNEESLIRQISSLIFNHNVELHYDKDADTKNIDCFRKLFSDSL